MRKVINFILAIISEPDGSPSASRVLALIFSGFTIVIIWRILTHVFSLNDPGLVSIYMSNLPIIITTCIGLIALPYGINKGSSTMSDIANMMVAAKQPGTNNLNSPQLPISTPDKLA